MADEGSPPGRYQGPFRHREKKPKPPPGSWLSPWRIYALGAIAALAVTGFYVLKLTLTPDMIRAATEDPPEPPPPPRNSLSAYCLSARGALRNVSPAPFCTEAREPGCRAGERIQLTYSAPVATLRWVFPLVMGSALQAHELVSRSQPVRPGAVDVPLVQWPVQARSERSAAALVGIFSTAPLEATEVRPWLSTWRTHERMLSRPPPLPPALTAKGATLAAFKICLGR